FDLRVVRQAQAAQVVEPILRSWNRHGRRSRLDVIDPAGRPCAACDRAAVAIAAQSRRAELTPVRRLVVRIRHQKKPGKGRATNGWRDIPTRAADGLPRAAEVP